MDPANPRRVLAYVPDLMDRSRLSAVPQVELRFAPSAAELETISIGWTPDVVLVDLARPGVIEALQTGGLTGRIIGFGSHVDTEMLDAAHAAGCHQVLPRSRFFADPGRALLSEPLD